MHWIDYIENEYPELKGHSFDTYIHNRDQLSKLVKEHREVVVQKIASQINSSIIRPDITSGLSHAYKEHDDQWSALLDELNKKKHILPVRKLIEQYEPIILKIAPCWLATPSAVSSIFPLKKNMFDLIIFDEASQSPVADSLTSLYRGKKVVVIGDEKQLRPSDLFELKEDEYEVDEDIDRTLLSESLLTLASRAFSYNYLKWHYRSAFQELIDFSNHAFYEGRLKIAPNILRGATPIRWIACNDGVWLDRKNIPEAIRVVDELKNIFITNKINRTNRSVGIITFNYQQRVEIENEIDRRRQKDLEFDKLYSEIDNPETRNLDDLPFVKNIENAQGDERDIIIFSLGYAKDLGNPEGTIGVHFGALNRHDGENRLNVAITRAKQEIVILCSFDPYKIKADDAEYDGPKRLKDYLCYAKSISELDNEKVKNILSSLDGPKSGKLSSALGERSLEKLVQHRLQKLGYQVDLKVGYSDYKIDLAVVHPDNPSRYILAIETDGESFTSANSTIERDIIRQDFLESRGWAVERIWSRNWWQDSDREITRLQQKIEQLKRINASAVKSRKDFLTEEKEKQSQEDILDEIQRDRKSIMNRLKQRESSNIELKSSFRYDVKLKQPNPKIIEKAIAKTIASFMNGEGGVLFIGVDDQGSILGLGEDYKTLKKQDSDGFEIELRQSVEKYTKNKAANEFFKVKFHNLDGKEICEIIVSPGQKPVFIYDEGGKQQECYVRIGNSSKPYNLDEFYEYCKRRFR